MKRVLSLEDLLGSTKLLKSGGSRGRGGGDSSGFQERQDLHRFCDSIRGCREVERAVEQDPENWDKLTKLFESGGSSQFRHSRNAVSGDKTCIVAVTASAAVERLKEQWSNSWRNT